MIIMYYFIFTIKQKIKICILKYSKIQQNQ